ncbi:MAG: hypothetical protein ACSLEW_14850 [Nocardioides sp.]
MLRFRILFATPLVVVCAACGGTNADPAPIPSTSTQVADPTTPTSSTSSTIPPELAGYSEKEREAYQDAVEAYGAFTEKDQSFTAAGETTVAAKDFYQKFSTDWALAWGGLGQLANNGVTVTGPVTVVWTKPKSIDLNRSTTKVTLRRCLDETERIVTQNGTEMEQPQFAEPHVYTVEMEKRPGESWWRSGAAEQGPTC